MSAPPPKVWTWNPSVITLLLILASILTGGGYYLGQLDAERRLLREQVERQASEISDTKKLAIYSAREVDNTSGHAKPDKEKK